MNPDSRCCRLRLTQQIYKQNLYVGGFLGLLPPCIIPFINFLGPL